MDNYKVSFKYHIGQIVYFLHKNYPKKGVIKEVNISIKTMNYEEDGWYLTPVIKYNINDNWYIENELWDDRKEFKKYLDKNLCYTKYFEHKDNFCLWNNQKVHLLSIIERTNNKHPWKKKKIAEIFYTNENNKGYFRYVLYEDISDTTYEKTYFENPKYELMRTYGMYYVEDDIYNFVNYDSIKF